MNHMIEFRITRSDLYAHDCIGHENISARQGHYFIARTAADALVQAKRSFPKDRVFTVQRTGKVFTEEEARMFGLLEGVEA